MANLAVIVTQVCCSLKGILIGFHEVELWTELSSKVASIGVAVEVAVLEIKIAIRGLSRHGDSVKSIEAAAIKATHVHFPLDSCPKEIRSEEVRLFWVNGLSIVDVCTAILRALDVLALHAPFAAS